MLSPAARRPGGVLGLAVALWATDLLRGLKPGWIALGAALFCILPLEMLWLKRIGALPRGGRVGGRRPRPWNAGRTPLHRGA
jgi:hypothetical protein